MATVTPTQPYGVIDLEFTAADVAGAIDVDFSDLDGRCKGFTVGSESDKLYFNTANETAPGFFIPVNQIKAVKLGPSFRKGPQIVKVWLEAGATVPQDVPMLLEDA